MDSQSELFHIRLTPQWIVLKARPVWLAKLRISCAIYLRTIREKMASQFASVTSEEIIEINFLVYIISLFLYILKRFAAR